MGAGHSGQRAEWAKSATSNNRASKRAHSKCHTQISPTMSQVSMQVPTAKARWAMTATSSTKSGGSQPHVTRPRASKRLDRPRTARRTETARRLHMCTHSGRAVRQDSATGCAAVRTGPPRGKCAEAEAAASIPSSAPGMRRKSWADNSRGRLWNSRDWLRTACPEELRKTPLSYRCEVRPLNAGRAYPAGIRISHLSCRRGERHD